MHDPLLHLAQPNERIPPAMVSIRHIRLDLESDLELAYGLFPILEDQQRGSQVVVRIRMLIVELDRLVVVRNGAHRVAPFREDHSEVVPGDERRLHGDGMRPKRPRIDPMRGLTPAEDSQHNREPGRRDGHNALANSTTLAHLPGRQHAPARQESPAETWEITVAVGRDLLPVMKDPHHW